MKNRLIFPSIRDKILKTRCRGEVLDIKTKEVIAVVYGKNLEEMRNIKHAVCKTIREIL